MKNILFLLLCGRFVGALVGGFGGYALAPQKPNPIINMDGLQLRSTNITNDNNARSIGGYEAYGIPIGMVAGLVVGAVIASQLRSCKKATGAQTPSDLGVKQKLVMDSQTMIPSVCKAANRRQTQFRTFQFFLIL